MKRSRILVMGTAIVVLPVMVGGFMLQRREATDAARMFAQVFARVAADAVDSVAPDAMYEKAARGLVKGLNDPYADLYSPQELSSFSRNSLGNSYGGVGIPAPAHMSLVRHLSIASALAITPLPG